MLLDRILAGLFDHSGKIVVAVLAFGGLFAWLTMPHAHPVSMLHERCREKQLPVRVIKLQPGSHEEERFLLMVPGSNREQLPDGHWAFCRANLQIRGGIQREER
ncbi:MAG TPA: hypothetical protein VNC82_10730 [Candidatus Limnocylindria bacterium]|nr:hypothetical protein [Candidatus Limnocylindria bacterium]